MEGVVVVIRGALLPLDRSFLGTIGSSVRGVRNARRRHQSREVQEGGQTQGGQGLVTQREVGVCLSL